ncbi:MAG: HK97 gp10 family phage protein [Candidatus Sumerlaeales bacterium]|nr:HK97 gp10 family phage protein [Candidatus Sumerlaeales bacterium]
MAVEIKGLNSLMSKLDRMGGNVLDALGKSVEQTTQVAIGDAEANVAVDTGMLQQSIVHGSDVVYNTDSVTGIVGTSAYYAIYQEMGTVKMAAHPFLMPALNANKSTFEQLARKELETAIKRTAGGG